MTTVQIECEPKLRRPRLFRFRWSLIVGGIAVLAASIAALRHYGIGFSHNKFKEGLAALGRGDFELTRRYARELKASQPSSPHAHFLRGALLLEKGFCYPALDELGKAKQEAGLETAALTLTGEAWYRLGRHVEAQAALQQALEQEPDSVDAHRWLAASSYDLGIVGKAIHHLERTAELAPTDPRPHRLLGLIHKDFGQYEAAIPLYEETLRRQSDQPNAAEIRQELASCQVETRRYKDALTTLAKSSDEPAVEVLRANCHHAQGDLARAKSALARALEQESDNLDGLLLQGTILLEEGEAQQAVAALQRAMEKHPRDYTVHFRIAQAYDRAGEPEQAEAQRKVAEEIRVIRHEFSQLHRAAGDHPRDAAVRLRLAALAQELGRPDLAEVWLRSAAALQPVPSSQNK